MKLPILFLIPVLASCSTLNESMQLGSSIGAVGGAAATYAAQSSNGEKPSFENVATGAGVGLVVGLITSYVTHKKVKQSNGETDDNTEMYFGDLPPSPFVFPKNNKKGGQ